MSGFFIPSYLDYSDGEADFKHLADSFTRRGPIRFKPVSGYYTAVPEDTDVVLRCDGTTQITIPADVFGSDNFATGAQVAVLNYSEKRVVIDPAAGVTINGPQRLSVDRWRWGVLVKQNANLWLLSLGNMGGGDSKGVPLPPKITACFGVSAGATILWDKPVDDGGSPITQYIVEESLDEKDWTGCGVTKPGETSLTVNDLKVGTKYFFRVKAVNANGISDPSNISDATPTTEYNDAEGGTVTTYTKDGRIFRVHTFLASGTLKINKASSGFRCLVVGGGGNGGNNTWGGGGGGGGVCEKVVNLPLGQNLVSVGGAGSGSSIGTQITAEPGQTVTGGNTGGNSGAPTVYKGAQGGNSVNGLRGGGGAGAGGDGLPFNYNYDPLSSRGGNPTNSDITGTVVAYAGGGSGSWAVGTGPDGPGGGGGAWNSNGEPNTGGGGGGGFNKLCYGGSGIVIVSYEIAPYNEATGGAITTVQNYNGTGQTWRVHQFTSNGQLDIRMSVKPFKVLVVAGGAGGAGVAGNNAQGAGGGNGGAGGARIFDNVTLSAGVLNVAVGGAGGGGNGGGQPCQGADGGQSSIGNMSTTGGGGGGIATGGRNGGSGGGGGCAVGNWGGPWGGGAGIAGEGTNGSGGSGNNDGSRAAGGAANLKSDITGSMRQYANGDYGNGGSGGDWQTPGGSGTGGVVIVAYQVADGSTGESLQEPALVNAARVTRAGNMVVNIEQVTHEWLNENSNDPWFYWVQYGDNLKDAQPAGIPFIGLGYEPSENRFIQPHFDIPESAKRTRTRKEKE